MNKLFLILLCALTGMTAQAQTTRYVRQGGTGNGSSWTNASGNLQSMINASASGDQVWVAAGTYKPGASRTSTFSMKNGVAIYGGFPNSGTPGMGDRDWAAYETILSGDIGTLNDATDNSIHVVSNNGLNNTAVLDGFTIRDGNANDFYPNNYGGGMYNVSASPTIVNCKFTANSAGYGGAGMANLSGSNAVVTSCLFTANSSAVGGGMHNDGSSPMVSGSTFSNNSGSGMYNKTSTATISNCTFSGNSGHTGAGMYNDGASPTVTNCTFSGNSGTAGGGVANSSGSSAAFTNCTFTANSVSSVGGGMYNWNSAPTVTDCIFTANTASNRGAGMYNFNASPSVANCMFSQNTGAYGGGGMANGSGSSPAVSNCTFTQNSATQWGGAMHNEENSNPTVDNCLIASNSAESGGGVTNIFNASPILTNCVISGNSANRGGGMEINSPAQIINCIIIGNTATTSGGGIRSVNAPQVVLTNCSFSGNLSPLGGAYENAFNSTITATNCIFWGNSSEIIAGTSSTFTVTYSIVQGGYPGTGNLDLNPIFVQQPPVGLGTSGNLRLQECSPAINAGTNSGAPATDLEGNPRPYGGTTDMGAYEYQAPVPPGANSVWYIDADGDDWGNTLVQQCTRPANGYMLSELSGLGDCNDGNAAINPGAAEICDGIDNDCDQQIDENFVCCPVNVVYVKAGATGANNGASWADAFTNLQDALALTNTCPTFNQIWVAAGVYKPTSGTDRLLSFSLKNGIAIYGGFNGTESQLSQRDWVQNETILSGDIGAPGVSSDNSYRVFYNTGINNTAILDGFTIRDGNANGPYPYSDGGGMLNDAASPTVSNCIFRLNTASTGGGMANFNNSAPALNNCTFTANHANSAGGVFNQFSNPSFSHCSFEGNTASWSGGGLYNYSSSPTLDNCTFSQNLAYRGAGMANFYTSSPNLNNCTFSANSASDNGGGIYNEQVPTFTITACNFIGNSAGNNGGGMYNQGSSPQVTDCLFSNNTATERGGGMYNFRESSPQVTGCIFTGNSAGRGGGMSNYGESATPAPLIRNCSFKGNQATLVGGGMDNTFCTPSVINCVFSGNNGSFGGGGMFNGIVAAPASVWNCSFSGNTANTGGGVLNSIFTSLIFTNCIFWGNSSETAIESNGSPEFQYSIIKQAGGVYPGTGNLNIDPLFVAQPAIGLGTGGDLSLQACSPAIDMGANAGAPTEDIQGNLRPFNSFGSPTARTDMGAWEYQQTQTPAGAPSVSINGPSAIGCAGATYTAMPVNGGPSPIYAWKVNGIPAGVSSATFTTSNLSTGDIVSCDMISSLPCAYPLIASSNEIPVTFTGDAPGNPAEFGNNEWRVYAWNAGGAEPTSGSWNTDYRGYYTASGMNFFTQSQWSSNLSPSAAPGYQGCPVGNDNHSWSAKRRGFACGYYQLSVTSHDDAAQLWINGTMVWEHIGCCDSHNNVWEGFLDANSEVEFRVTEGGGGSHGGLFFQQITAQIAQTGSLCNAASAALALQNNPTGNYLWSTGETTSSITVTEPGTYSVTLSNGNGCSISTSVDVIGVAGNPAEFGDNVWNVYAWNAGGAPANSWNTDYAGFYTYNGLDFISNSWYSWTSPALAPGYQGCPVNYDNHSWSAKRKGFPCGYYQINAGVFDDYGQLWINGQMVWDGYYWNSGPQSNIWRGFLDAESEVEFRIMETVDYSTGVLYIHAITPTLTGLSDLCSASTATLAVQGNPAGNYLWSTGETTPSILITAPGAYAVTVDNGNGCSISTSGTANGPAGNPAVFGDHVWNVYAWNAGEGHPTSSAWNTAYSGYYAVSTLNFNTQNQWNKNLSPSAAPGYQGCPAGNDNHSYSAKRRGFPCGFYRISVDSHDDAAQLWINGVMVWDHIGCCDSHSNAWEGFLNADSEVEFRVTEGGGESHGALSFHLGNITLTGTPIICHGASTGSISAQVIPGASYSWSNGAGTPSISNLAAGVYSLTVSVPGCSEATASFAIGEHPGTTISGETEICEGSSTTLTANINGPVIWNSGSYTFVKTYSGHADEITPHTHITRYNWGFIFNSVSQTGPSGSGTGCLPVSNIEWALGDVNDWASLTFVDYVPIPNCGSAPNIVNLPLVMHLIQENIYLQVVFSYWQSGGGGNFTYTRTTGPSILWSTGATTPSINVTASGNYSVTVSTGGNNCTSTASRTVTVTPLTTWYADADSDGYGDPMSALQACTPPAGHVNNNTDCNDNNANEYPGQAWYIDVDGDGYAGSTLVQCARPVNGFLLSELTGTGDCDDNDADAFPGQTWYIDADGDGYAGATLVQCARPANGFVLSDLSGIGDCNDANPNVNPGAMEVCDGVDNNCNAQIDENNVCCLPLPAHYAITTNGGILAVTDLAGNSDVLTLSEDGGGIRFETAVNRSYTLDGGPLYCFPVTIPGMANFSTVQISAGGGDDEVRIVNFAGPMPDLSIHGGAGDLTMAADLTITGPAARNLTLTSGGNLLMSQTASGGAPLHCDVEANGNVTIHGSGWRTNGGSFSSSGIIFSMNSNPLLTGGGDVTLTHTGNVTVQAAGVQTGGGDFHIAAAVNAAILGNGLQTAGGDFSCAATSLSVGQGGVNTGGGDATINVSGNVSLTDNGLNTCGPGGPGHVISNGVNMNMNSSGINTCGGNVTLNHTGDVTAVVNTAGGAFSSSGQAFTATQNGVNTGGGNATLTHSGNVAIQQGGLKTGGGNFSSTGANFTVSDIGLSTSGGPGGNVTLTHTGSVLVQSAGAQTGGGDFAIAAATAVTVTGNGVNTSGGDFSCTASSLNVNQAGVQTGGGEATINVSGNVLLTDAGLNTCGAGGPGHVISNGVNMNMSSSGINTCGGNVALNHTGDVTAVVNTTGGAFSSSGLAFTAIQNGVNTGGGNATLNHSGHVSIQQYGFHTAGGNFSSQGNGGIHIKDGGLSSGNGTVIVNHSGSAVLQGNVGIQSNANVSLSANSLQLEAPIQAGIGQVFLQTPNGTAPWYLATDVIGYNLSFAGGSPLQIRINGTAANTGYDVLTVNGLVNLAGVTLQLSGSHTPAVGQTFTIVNNVSSEATTGAFNGLPQGAIITGFLGSFLNASITYAGGDGNDVVLTVVAPCDPIACPPAQTLPLAANCSVALPDYTSLAVTDAGCTVQSITQSPAPGTIVSGTGIMQVTISVTYTYGNTENCSFTVTKVDNTPPTITCPASLELVLSANCSALLPDYTGMATAGDNCGVQSVTQSPLPGTTVSGAGPMSVTLTVTDVNNLTNTCTFTVNKVDNTPPTAICQNATVYLDASGNASVTAAQVNNGSFDNCGIQSLSVSPNTFTCANVGPNTVTLTVTDVNNLQSTCTATVNVAPKATVSSISVSPNTRQYSDEVTFTATIQGGATCGQSQAAQYATFFVGTQNMGSADFEVQGNDLVAILGDICLLEGIAGQMAPGAKSVSAVFHGIDAVYYAVSQPAAVSLQITPENATVAYNGQEYFTTPSQNTCTGTVTLMAYAADDTDPAQGCRGDIRNARITFSNGGIPGSTLGTANLPVGLINPTNIHEGIAVTNFTHTLNGSGCSSGGETFEVWVRANNYYTGQTDEDEVTLVTLALPGNDFVTGGGHLVLSNSAGTYAGTAGSKMNFGFNMRWNSSGKNLQGRINIIFRRLVNGQWRTYQIKSNAINSMSLNETSDYRRAIISTKASLQDITNATNPVSLGGNLNLAMNAWEHKTVTNGSMDQISVTLSGSGSQGLLFASHWSGSGVATRIINGGKIKVRSNATGQSLATNTLPPHMVQGQSQVQVSDWDSAAESNAYILRMRNQPNPFQRETDIWVEMNAPQMAVLRVFDNMGRPVMVLHEGMLDAGMHRFHFDAGDLPGGFYYYTLSTGGEVMTGKMLLAR